jgi:polysaccharide export outer membrane protein
MIFPAPRIRRQESSVEGTTLSLQNPSCSRGYRLGLRIGFLLAIFVGVMPGVLAKSLLAQTAPASESSRKATEKSNSKGEAPAVPKANSPDAAGAVDPTTYHIGLDDQLMISVWREPELSMNVVVRPDGVITLPLLNDVHVVGLKPIELQQILTEKLKSFVSEPQVTVIVQGIKSRKVFLVGNVSKQGAFNLEGGETALQLLAAAGGVSTFGKADSIYILRTENKKQIRIPFQYKKALKGRTQDDVLLQPGDVVVVP